MTSDDADARRRELFAKRDILRAQQAERETLRKRQAAVAEFERWHAPYLAEHAVDHVVLWPWESPPAGPINRYPVAGSGIDWWNVDDAVRRPAELPSFLRALFDEAFEDLCVPYDRIVHAYWGSRAQRLALKAGDLAAHAHELSRWSSDLWVFDPDADWLIEVYHEGRFGYAPRPPTK